MNEWSESVWVAVSLIVMSIVILFSVNVMHLSKEITGTIDNQEAVTTRMKEFRKYNAYNGEKVYAQDVVSAILETRGYPYVKLITQAGNIHYWNSSDTIRNLNGITTTPATPYTSTDILTKLNVNKMYYATLIKGGNGEVIGLMFQEVNP